MSLKNARTVGIRLDSHDTARLTKFEDETSIEGVSLARAALKAALDHYESHGSISIPLKVVPKESPAPAKPKIITLREHIQTPKVAEDPSDYGSQA